MRWSPTQRTINRPSIDFKLISGILGGFIFFMGFALISPLPIALVYGESIWWVYLLSGGIAFFVGGLVYLFNRPSQEIRSREAFFIVCTSWLVLASFGSTPFLLTGNLTNFTDAFFETMSGLTTTGATIFGGINHSGHYNANLEDLPKSILFWRSMLHWIGGMGFIVLTIAIFPLVGLGTTTLFQAESSVLDNDKFTPRVQQTALFLWSVYILLTALHFLLLWIHPKMDWFDAINHAMSTLATGGFSTKDSSVAWFDSYYIDFIIIIFMYLAGISFAMHFRLLRGEVGNFFNNRETRFYSLIVFIAVFIISIGLWFDGNYNLADSFRYGAFQALSILTTTGYSTHDYSIWPAFSLIVLIMLYFTGACAGSTSGGVKMFRHLIMFRAAGRQVRQSVHPKAVLPLRIGNRIIEPDMVVKIFSFFMLYLVLFLTGGLILTLLGLDIVTAMSASIASLGSVGPALGDFGPTNNYAGLAASGKWLLSILMLIGRLEVLTVLVLFSSPFWKG